MMTREQLFQIVDELNQDYNIPNATVKNIIEGLTDPYAGIDIKKLLIKLDEQREIGNAVSAETAAKEYELLKDAIFRPIDEKYFSDMKFNHQELLYFIKNKGAKNTYISERSQYYGSIEAVSDKIAQSYKAVGDVSKPIITIKNLVSKGLAYSFIAMATLIIQHKCSGNKDNLPPEHAKEVKIILQMKPTRTTTAVKQSNEHERC